jgi:pimeloyl-ACP methyl ester carboxylesterase
MQRTLVAGILTILAAPVLAAAPANAAVKAGPAGDAFYTPPASLPSGPHGTPIWQRKLTGEPVLKSAKANTLLLYRSTAVDGKTVAVSGDVAVPKGKAPKGGWPVITWAHGTVGIADSCAPSKIGTQANYDSPLLNSWLKAGYAVVRTDYEGLGTPGPHPYLIGVSEGRSTLDMVRAARKLNPDIGSTLVIAGHSQGGQAALFAASLSKKWTPELKLQGTVAFAPVSHLSEQSTLLGALTAPGGLAPLAGMILRGIDIGDPSVNVQSYLSDAAKALYPQIDEKCLDALSLPDSFGSISPAGLIQAGANVAPITAALAAKDDPDDLKISGPVLIEQGKADTTVIPSFTTTLSTSLKAKVTYKTYDGVNHAGAVTAKKPSTDATKWIKKLLKG